jgi:hypothetical protein
VGEKIMALRNIYRITFIFPNYTKSIVIKDAKSSEEANERAFRLCDEARNYFDKYSSYSSITHIKNDKGKWEIC